MLHKLYLHSFHVDGKTITTSLTASLTTGLCKEFRHFTALYLQRLQANRKSTTRSLITALNAPLLPPSRAFVYRWLVCTACSVPSPFGLQSLPEVLWAKRWKNTWCTVRISSQSQAKLTDNTQRQWHLSLHSISICTGIRLLLKLI